MICISCWSHGNRLDFIVVFLWSHQALIHFSFALLAKHIMWIWSFVPDSPRLTSLSPQAPDVSQRSRGRGEEFRWIQRLLWISYDSSIGSPASPHWPRDPLANRLPGPGGLQLCTSAQVAWVQGGFLLYNSRHEGSSSRPSLWFDELGEQTLAWLALNFSSRLHSLMKLQMSCQVFPLSRSVFFYIAFWNSSQAVFRWVGRNIERTYTVMKNEKRVFSHYHLDPITAIS